MNPIAKPLRRVLEGQLAGETAADRAEADRHLRFLVGQLTLGVIGLVAFPVWLALGAPGSSSTSVIFVWLLSPLAIAVFVLRTGRLRAGQLLSSFALIGLVVWGCLMTGGVRSPMIVLFVFVPLAARVMADQPAAKIAMAGALAGLGICAGLEWIGAAAEASPAEFGLSSAILVAAATVLVALWPGPIAGTAPSAAQGLRSDRQLLDQSSDLITCHSQDGGVLWSSSAASELFGVAPEALNGRGLADRVHIEDRVRFDAALEDVSSTGVRAALTCRLQRQNHDGRNEWISAELSFSPLLHPGSERGAVIGVTRDVSRHKAKVDQLAFALARAEAEIAAHRQDLAQRRHELEAPLQSIIGFSELLADEKLTKPESDDWRDYARLIRGAGKHLREALDDLLGQADHGGREAPPISDRNPATTEWMGEVRRSA